ncbi:MAG: hypothetical protein ACLGPL_10485 [Acidobacteriota bacterium]
MSQTLHRIDGRDTIIHIDDSWIAFARENGLAEASKHDFIGRPLWNFIEGPETKHLWRLMLGRVRSKQTPIWLSYRCDAPDRRRYMRMGIIPHPNMDVEMYNTVVKEEVRKSLRVLDPAFPRDERVIKICSWCKRVLVGSDGRMENMGEWMELEDAVERLKLFESASLPSLNHGICNLCFSRVIAEIP